MNTVSVILPTYNEVGNIGSLLATIQKQVRSLKEIIVVDDNSPDHTAKEAKRWARTKAGNAPVRVVIRTRENGLQKSISEGIRLAKGTVVVWMDADFSHPPAVINQLTTAITKGADIAVASRYIAGGQSKTSTSTESPLAIWMSSQANMAMRMLFGVPFHDFTSGFIAIKKEIIMSLPLTGEYGEYFIDCIVRAFRKGYRIVEIPYMSPARLHGISKTAPNMKTLLTRFRQYGTVIIRLIWHPHAI